MTTGGTSYFATSSTYPVTVTYYSLSTYTTTIVSSGGGGGGGTVGPILPVSGAVSGPFIGTIYPPILSFTPSPTLTNGFDITVGKPNGIPSMTVTIDWKLVDNSGVTKTQGTYTQQQTQDGETFTIKTPVFGAGGYVIIATVTTSAGQKDTTTQPFIITTDQIITAYIPLYVLILGVAIAIVAVFAVLNRRRRE